MAAPLGGLTASQLDQPLLDVPLDLDLVRPRGLASATQGGVEALGDQLSADARDGPRADPQRGDDLVIGASSPPESSASRRMRAWVSLRAAALPLDTNCSNSARSSVVNVTRYLSIAVILCLRFVAWPSSHRIPLLPVK